MNPQLKSAVLGGVFGALISVVTILGLAFLGYFPPPSDQQFERYLMSHPAIVFAMSEKAQEEQAESDERKRQDAVDALGSKTFFDPKVAFVTGPANAKRTVVEFFDYNCVHCRNSFPAVQKFYSAHKNDTRFAFVEFPIFGQASNNAARAALAARLQKDKYVAFHFALMGEEGSIGTDQILHAARQVGLDVDKLTNDLKNPAVDRQMTAAHALAARAGIDGTPTFIINGKVHSGEVTESELKQMSRS